MIYVHFECIDEKPVWILNYNLRKPECGKPKYSADVQSCKARQCTPQAHDTVAWSPLI